MKLTPEFILACITVIGGALLAIDRWVHRRHSKEQLIDAKVGVIARDQRRHESDLNKLEKRVARLEHKVRP